MSTTVPNPRRWWALAVLAAAQFIVIMDTSIIGVALPEIQRALGFSQAGLSWVFNAYVIAFGGLLLLGGRLADLAGARRVFLLGFAGLTAASLLAGLAWSDDALLLGRALQGLGSALIAPAALTLLMVLFGHDPRELTKAFAFYGAAAPAGGTAGVFLGGALTEWLDWRWVFLVNVPVALAVLAASPALLPKPLARRGGVDVVGAVSVTAALSLAVYAIADGVQPELLGLAALLLGLFVVVQRVRTEPLLPLAIFRAPNLTAGNAGMAMLGAAWIPMWFFLNLYLQQVLGYSALASGLALVPMTLAIMGLMVGLTARLVGRFGFKRNLVAGLVLLAAAMVAFAFVPVEGSFLTDVLPASLLAALGMSLAFIPANIAGLSGAKPEEAGLASGLINTSYQIGSALGLAAMTAVAAAVTSAASVSDQQVALTGGFQAAFVGAAAVAVVGALVALLTIHEPRAAAPAASIEPAEELRAA